MTRSSSAASRSFAAALLGGLLLIAGCITRSGEPHPLYPDAPRPPEQVARLFGPIAAVDGQDVSRLGKSFSVLPGCHVVQLLNKVGQINTSNGGGYVGITGGALFALRMRASFTYEIEVQVESVTGPVGQLTIQTWERPADGSSATPLAPARTADEIGDCQRWTP
jgi:hypothetical protein